MGRNLFRRFLVLLVLASVLSSMLLSPSASLPPVFADHTPDPVSVTVVGSLQDELGCPGDWQADCFSTHIAYDVEDGVWQAIFGVPAGSWEYKAALNDSWDENYGANATPNGPNIPLDLGAPTDVKFYYDHETHWVIDNQNVVIATVPGSYQAALGCTSDWDPGCLRSWLQDADGDGTYSFDTAAIPAGDYEAKVAINESWAENYGAGGVPGGPNIPFVVAQNGSTVIFTYDPLSHILSIDVIPPGPSSVTVAGSLQSELGCPDDWDPACSATHLAYDAGDDVWQGTWPIPAGNWEYKAALNDSWDENYGANAIQDGPNIPLALGAATDVRFYYDHDTHWVTDHVNSIIATVPGSYQDEIGCPGDWQPDCLRSWLQDPDGDGTYAFSTSVIPAGDYEAKVAIDESWNENYGAGGVPGGDNIPFSVAMDGSTVTFTYDPVSHILSIDVIPPGPGLDDNIWWDGLGHNSRDDLYRVPGGAVTTGTPVTVRFRTFHNDVTDVTLRVWSTAAGTQSLYPMEVVATTDEAPYGYDWWQATLPAQEDLTILYYRFIVRDGSDEDFYEDDDLFDGGWGTVYEDSPDYSFQIDVYDPGFEAPEWMKNAVVYQLFPDRFYNGHLGNDPKPSDPTIYENPILVKAWDDLPEGYCRAYQDFVCDEGPLGRDFFGGDLKGVRQKLDYLADLGVTAIYFNPIFEAPSNHLYDTTDYYQIDPYFGPYGQFDSLLEHTEELGIHLILDGVFNHTSSDSVYFDKYSRYKTLGAYESQDSKFYDWYTFFEWPDSYDSWWGFDSLPVLTEIQPVQDFIFGADDSVARWWIQNGASGWRLDVAPDKSHEFWAEFRPSVKSADPEAIIIGEIWDDASEWVLGDELDTTMNYRFRRALLGFLNEEGTNDPNQGWIAGLNADQFNSVLQSIKEDYPPPAYETAMNLVGTHDTQRILWALTPGARNREDKEFNLENLAEGKAKLELLAIMQMTMPGAPTIYYGDEVGLTGDTDPDDRRPFPWDGMDTDMLAHYQALTGLRGTHSFLRTGSFDRLYTHNDDGTYAFGRKDATGAAVVAINRDAAAHGLTIDLTGYIPDGTVLTDALSGGTYTVTSGQVTVDLVGRWGAVLITPPGTDLTPPDVPTGLLAAVGDGFVDLSWDAVPGAAGYYVYRSPVSGGGYDWLNGLPLADPAYTDDTVVNGSICYYVVTAVDDAGNESARSHEVSALPHLTIGWANLQWPPSIAHTISALDPTENIYGQVWIDGHTSVPGPTEGLIAQVGFGPYWSDPNVDAGWTWVDAAFNGDAGNNDEFRGQLLPEAVGTYDYAYRYSTTGGLIWVYADRDGTDNGYDPAQAGDLTVNPSSDTSPPEVPGNLYLLEASPSFVHLAWDAVPDADLYRYEVYRGDATGGPYAKVANVLAPAVEYTDMDVVRDASYYYVVLAADTSFNKSAFSNELEATAQARSVQVTFNATLPDTTPDGDDMYMGGSFNGWNPAGTLMTRTDLFATVTLTFDEGSQIEYKYTRGSWTYVEKDAECNEIDNRTATIIYGTDGTMALDDIVLNWRNTGTCPD